MENKDYIITVTITPTKNTFRQRMLVVFSNIFGKSYTHNVTIPFEELVKIIS